MNNIKNVIISLVLCTCTKVPEKVNQETATEQSDYGLDHIKRASTG